VQPTVYIPRITRALLFGRVPHARLSAAQGERRNNKEKKRGATMSISFMKWRSNNSDLHNWQKCPSCNGSGEDIEIDDLCPSCNGSGRVDDLHSLYMADVERDQIAHNAQQAPTTNAARPGE